MLSANGLSESVAPSADRSSCLSVESARVRLVHDVRIALRRSGHSELRAVEIEIADDRIIITGRVPSFYLKQMAQELARSAAPYHQICNELEVKVLRNVPR